jgi:hypothetical protein
MVFLSPRYRSGVVDMFEEIVDLAKTRAYFVCRASAFATVVAGLRHLAREPQNQEELRT